MVSRCTKLRVSSSAEKKDQHEGVRKAFAGITCSSDTIVPRFWSHSACAGSSEISLNSLILDVLAFNSVCARIARTLTLVAVF